MTGWSLRQLLQHVLFQHVVIASAAGSNVCTSAAAAHSGIMRGLIRAAAAANTWRLLVLLCVTPAVVA